MIAQHIADMAPQRLLSLTLVMTSSGAEGLPAPSESLLRLLARREAASREQAVEQQADLLAALGSRKCATIASNFCCRPHVPTTARSARKVCSGKVAGDPRRTQPGAAAEPSAGADPGDPWHRRSAAAGDARRCTWRRISVARAEADPRSRHRFQEAFKEPLLAAVVPYLKAHRQSQRRPALKRALAVSRRAGVPRGPPARLPPPARPAPPGPARSPGGSARPAGRARRDRRSRG